MGDGIFPHPPPSSGQIHDALVLSGCLGYVGGGLRCGVFADITAADRCRNRTVENTAPEEEKIAMIVAIDYDGTIADTNRQKMIWIHANLGIEVEPWQCNRTDCVPLIGREAYERMGMDIYERECSLRAPEVPGALDALCRLSAGASLHVVTARPPRIMAFAREWLQKRGIDGCVEDVVSSEGTSKSEICARIGARFLIDDDVRHLQDAEPVGLVRLLMQEGREKPPASVPGILFCGGWGEVVRIVEGLG